MALKYYLAENYGNGFITHEDSERAHIAGYPGNIWVTENVQWAQRIGAIEKTKSEAQAIVDAAISGTTYNDMYPDPNQPIVITLP